MSSATVNLAPPPPPIPRAIESVQLTLSPDEAGRLLALVGKANGTGNGLDLFFTLIAIKGLPEYVFAEHQPSINLGSLKKV